MDETKYKGLAQEEAEKKLEEYGKNEIVEVSKVSPLGILIRQIKSNFIIYLLFFATILSFFVGKAITAYTILFVILLIIVVGFIQEYKAEKAIDSLKKMIHPVSIVIRDGKEVEILSENIVPGDIVVLRSGEKVSADCLVLEEVELLVNEAVLTGESKEVKKQASKGVKKHTDEHHVFMGTYVISGKCVAKVLHTGMNTEFGKIASMISTAEKELPLQMKVNVIAKYMVYIAIIMSLMSGFLLVTRGWPLSYNDFIEILVVVIALSVSAFPEGFPVVLITTLSSGAYKMAKKNAIVNRMSIIETLGETTIICSDKTGTITKGEMTVKKIYSDDRDFEVEGVGYDLEGDIMYKGKKVDLEKHPVLALLLKSAIFCNDARLEQRSGLKEYKTIGTPTELALLVMSKKADLHIEDLDVLREEERPFSSERKMMSVLYKEGKERNIYTKGALERILPKCRFVRKGNRLISLSDREKKRIMLANKELTSKGLRTIALAYKSVKTFKREKFEEDLVFLGLAGIEDPPREEVKESIRLCKTAGIKVKMITGDNKETAVAIAKQIGLGGSVILGEGLDKITDDELLKVVKKVTIFARVDPEHKLRIVRALKQNGEIVTMTGDGVNDAPALKESHIGVAMGKNGTDVSREASDLILRDDNFSTIVSAVSEGRTIFSNIRKFVTYQLSCNFSELAVIFIGLLLNFPLPLLALQILFMNLVTDDLPAITLGFNPASHDVMTRGPRRESNILNKNLFVLLAFSGLVMAIATLGIFYYDYVVLEQELIVARTSAFVTLIFAQIGNAFNFRSFRKPLHRLKLFANKYLIYASIASVVCTLVVIYTPLSVAFEVTPIGIYYWFFAVLASLLVVVCMDIFKLLNLRYKFLDVEH